MAETRLSTFWGGKCRDEVNYPLPFTSYFWRTRRAVCNTGILIACDTLATGPFGLSLVHLGAWIQEQTKKQKRLNPGLALKWLTNLKQDFCVTLWWGDTAGRLLTLWQHCYASRTSLPRGKTSGRADLSTQLGSSKSFNSGVTCENNCTHLVFHINIVVLPGEEI